ncbi:MAG: hypothetical protein BVN28_02450 [Nitrospira sp. ST-bin4]|nr:MAG: hypothetical protein BVN28_02450 [Nitrospira sp. ST-bin4]
MLLVILGAGASYDSAPSRPASDSRYSLMPERPPMANDLFGDRQYFGNVMNKYPQCLPIIQQLRDMPEGTIEKQLQKLQTEAANYPTRLHQLAAIRYYLQEMLFELPQIWLKETQSISNYLALVDHIRKSGERACFVTFNYDTLLDGALEQFGYALRDFPSYIKNDLPLIKLHGSVSWGRLSTAPIDIKANRLDIANSVIDSYSPDFITDQYVLVGEFPPAPRQDRVVFPALAIPVESKLQFECPVYHIDKLKSFLPDVTRILVIGWRGTEEPFLNLLREGIKQVELVMVINGGESQSEEASSNLRRARILASRHAAFDGGFTEFFKTGAADDFLRRP